MTVIEAHNLEKHFTKDDSILSKLFGRDEEKDRIKAVDGVNFSIDENESFGIAGESGCGKTTLGKTCLFLHEPTGGEIRFLDRPTTTADKESIANLRKNAQLIPQDPYRSINPRFKVVDWVKEPLDIHSIGSRTEREERAMKALEDVGLRPAEMYANKIGAGLSGGERQRVNIARAIVINPAFVVADEPASMLDVSIRASILHLLNELREEHNIAIMFISHDLSLLKHMCDRLAIMYLGKIVEIGSTKEIIDSPKHPYTKALVNSTSAIDPTIEREDAEIEGEIQDPVNLPPGCRFAPRCPERMEACTTAEPPLYELPDQEVRCILYEDEEQASTEKVVEQSGHQ